MPTGARDPRMRSGARRRLIKAAKVGTPKCWICAEPIDISLPRGDVRSFTLDEVTPRSLGGDPLNPNNVKPAHLSCNSRRGGRMAASKQRAEAQREQKAIHLPRVTRDEELW